MYRFVLFAAVVMVVGAVPNPEGMPACRRIMHGGLACCKRTLPPMTPPENIKECFQMAKKPPSCDLDICIAKKVGLASDDGTIDKKKMAEEAEKNFASEPALVEGLKEHCINGDLSKFGPADMCDLLKQKKCYEVEFIRNCNDWNDEGDCSGMKDLAEECLKQFS